MKGGNKVTILQLKYVIMIANSGSFREAANRLFVSQPALSTTIKELEAEIGIQLFERTNKGIRVTKSGEDFINYAKRAVSQYKIIEERYIDKEKEKSHFSVSMQHYVFAVHAFANVVREYHAQKYVYAVKETQTDKVLDDVRELKSDVGIISYSQSNVKVMKKLLRDYGLKFVPLMVRETYVYVWKKHPLADRSELSLSELTEYPCVSFDQNSDNEFYLSEEALGDYDFDKLIKSSDRATSAELMTSLNGYSIGTGNIIDSQALKKGIIAIKLKEEDPLTIGYIVKKNHKLSDIAEKYIQELLKYKELN